ncbi:MAG: YIP1 family protein [Sedimentisphaerales bacterium]|nr:YIP1 family protein [Sedimentisphaerales bacterium]
MEGPNIEEPQNLEDNQRVDPIQRLEKQDTPKPKRRKLFIVILCIALPGAAVGIWAFIRYAVPKVKEMSWTSNQMIAIYIAAGFLVAVVIAWFLLHRTLRTRLRMEKAMYLDPDINDWLIIFNWTPKILYVPTIIASLLASVLMYFSEAQMWFFGSIPGVVIGACWLGVFFLNFLVEEYSISIKILLISLVSLGCFLLWLHLLGWVMGFLRLFKHLALSINGTGYLLIGVIGLLTIFISWFKGLFYYMTITPNYMNIQEGPTESGEQIGREDYNSKIDTSDFLERLMGFGKIIITFKDRKREPITVLVWRIQKKAQMLEKVRAKFAIDHQLQQPPFVGS